MLLSCGRRRYGLALAAFALFCLLATILTVGAGAAFYEGRPFVEGVLRDHKAAGETLRLVAIAFTAAILMLVVIDWLAASGRRPRALRARSLGNVRAAAKAVLRSASPAGRGARQPGLPGHALT